MSDTLFENKTGFNYANQLNYGTYWGGQTFLTTSAHSITSVKLFLYRSGNPGTITLSLRATSGGLPTGGDLTSGTIDGNSLPTSSTETEISLTSYDLDNATTYALIIRAPSGDGLNQFYVGSTFSYAGGTRISSSDSGANWATNAYDWLFKVYGIASELPGNSILFATNF